MAETTALEHFRYRIRRDTQGLVAWFRGNWQQKRWFRWVTSAGAAGLVFLVAFWAFLASGLPDAETLVDYEPPLPTMVRGLDGEIVHSRWDIHGIELRQFVPRRGGALAK